MNSGIYPALSGAVSASHAMENLANNLANLGTASFRGQRISFSEALGRAQGQRKTPDQRFVRTEAPRLDPTPGTMRQTGQERDLALAGPGFLAVRTPKGERYQRGGPMQVVADGRLTTADGHELLDTRGEAVRVPPRATLAFGERGEVVADGKVVSTLKLVEFASPQGVRGEGGGLYAAAQPPQQATRTTVLPGHLESANVNALRAMTDVVLHSRHFEALHRVIETYREVDTAAARELAAVA